MFLFRLLLIVFIIVVFVGFTYASIGDRNRFHQKCLDGCIDVNCTADGDMFKGDVSRPLVLELTMWSCKDECRYMCMWKVVDHFLERSWAVPQFYGKWPFLRICGLQEPASMLFSLMNLAAHIIMWRKFRRYVLPAARFYYLWQIHSLVCIHAWLWSAIFHAREFNLTEKMDYIGAFSIILFSFCSMLLRIIDGQNFWVSLAVCFLCLGFFVQHVIYLLFVNFDYGYNMIVNILTGFCNSVGWLIWCWKNRSSRYVSNCVKFVIFSGLFLLLEMVDFPPIFWLLDPHALWHLSTSFLPYYFYTFLIDDCMFRYNRKSSMSKKKIS